MTDSLAVTTSAPKLILNVRYAVEFNTGDEKTAQFAPTHSCGRWATELRAMALRVCCGQFIFIKESF